MSSDMEQMAMNSGVAGCGSQDNTLCVEGKSIFSACIAPYDFARLLSATKRTVRTDEHMQGAYGLIRLEFDDKEGTAVAVSLDGYRLCTLKVWLPGPITSEEVNAHVYISPDLPKPNKRVPMVGISVVESISVTGKVERTAYVKYGEKSYGFKQPENPTWGIDWRKVVSEAIQEEPVASVTVNAALLQGVIAARLDADRGFVDRPLVTIELYGETKPVMIFGSRSSESVSMILPVRRPPTPDGGRNAWKQAAGAEAAEASEEQI